MIYLELCRNTKRNIRRILCSLYAGIVVLYVAANGVVGKQYRWRHVRIALHTQTRDTTADIKQTNTAL